MTDFTDKKNNWELFLFLGPLMLSGAFQSLYSLVNAAVVGRVISSDAVAVIGACGSMNTLVSHLFGGMSAGIAVYLGRCIGSRDPQTIGKAFRGAEGMLILMMIPAAIAAAFPRYPAMAANISEQIFPQACLYLRYLFLGAFLVGMKGLLIGLLQGFGDSRIVGFTAILSVVSQTLIVLLLVGGLRMGVEGSALATILNNMLFCAIYAVYYRRSYPKMVPFVRPARIEAAIWKELAHNAAAKSSMMLIIWVGSFTFNRQINLLPSLVIASHTYARSIYNVFVEIVSAFGTAAAVTVGQNYGMKTEGRKGSRLLIPYYTEKLLEGSLLVSLLIALLFCLFGRELCALAAGVAASDEIARTGAVVLRIAGYGFPGLALLLVGRYGLQAMGHYRIQPVLGVLETIVNCTCAGFVVRYGIVAVGWCVFLKWVLPGIVAGIAFVLAVRHERQVEQNEYY